MPKFPLIAVLRVKPFLFLWLAQVFSQLAGNLLNFVLLLRIAELTKSNTMDSLFVIAISLPAFLFGGIAGVYVDYHEKKNVLFFCNLLRIIAVLFFVLTSETIVWIFILTILISVITQFFLPAEAPLIPDFVDQKLLLAANSLFNFTFYSSVIIGFMLAGPFLVLLGENNIFYFCAFLFLSATILVGLLPGANSWLNLSKMLSFKLILPAPKKSLKLLIKKFLIDLKEGYDYVKDHKPISEAIIIMAGVQVLIATMAAISPGYAEGVLRLKITDASLYIVAPTVAGMIMGSILIGILGVHKKVQGIISTGIIFSGIFLTGLSFLSRGKYSHFFQGDNKYIVFGQVSLKFDILHLAIIFLFALGLSSALVTVSANTILQSAEGRVRSRMYGFLTAVSGIGAVIPVIGAGVLSDLLGVVKVMLALGTGILLFGLVRLKKANFK